MAMWLVWNFDTCSYSLSLANRRTRVTEHDGHVTLGPLEVVEPKNEINVTFEFRTLLNHWKQQWPKYDSIPKCGELIKMIQGQVDGGENFKRNFVIFMVSTCLRGNQTVLTWSCGVQAKVGAPSIVNVKRESVTGFGRGYLENTLHKMSMTDEEEQVNENEHHSENVEDEGKAKDQTGISKVKVSQICLIILLFLKTKKKEIVLLLFSSSFPSKVSYSFDYKYWLSSSGSFVGRLGANQFDNSQHLTADRGFDSWSTHPTQESKRDGCRIDE
ncbi:hypothetical protein Cgig2_000294 [Carnegiea gigantea]|uniref:Uncharacterized protein n=1 Tax=Carnegiea gigantea TaxID=171969 RepID=A0A9Q1QB16_9CARY|nr:hypothetical protein Cgig2_000294 [Carnegiea gigantea]